MIRGGQRYSGAVSLVDVAATILDMADVPTERRQFMDMEGDFPLPLLHGVTMKMGWGSKLCLPSFPFTICVSQNFDCCPAIILAPED